MISAAEFLIAAADLYYQGLVYLFILVSCKLHVLKLN